MLRFCLHLLTATLLAVVAARSVSGNGTDVAGVLSAAVVMAAVYAAGLVLARAGQPGPAESGPAGPGASQPLAGQPRPAVAAWLAAVTIAWLVLLALTPDAVWLAFPLFFVQLHLLPLRPGLAAVGVTTVLAIAGFAGHQHALTPAAVIGPVIGAAVAVATVLGYQALYRESEHRRRLIEQLTATRGELAAAERAAGVLAERERLAREIHDTLAQGLSSIQLLLRAAERSLPVRPEAAAAHVAQARATAQDNLAEARRFVRALAPPGLAGHSLPDALERLCVSTGARAGLDVRFRLSGDPVPVPTPQEAAMLRIAQSALANTVAHAGATRATLTLSYMDNSIALDAVDDGGGFDPAAVTAQAAGDGDSSDGGFGLTAMRARASELGGTVSIESAPGHGTALTVSFPLAAGNGERPGRSGRRAAGE